MRLAVLDSWLRQPAAGSGTAVAWEGWVRAWRAAGHEVDRVPYPALPGLALRRLTANLLWRWRFDPRPYDLVFGADFDGALVRRPARYVVAIKGVAEEERRQERGAARALFRLWSALEARNARRADGVLATSRYCAAAIARHYGVPPGRIAVVPEGIDLAAWRAALAGAPPRRDPRPTILAVARFYRRKRLDLLVEAFARVRRHQPEARLVLVGDGPERRRVRSRIRALGLEAAVDAPGAVGWRALVAAYAHADVFALPSVQEGFGIVFLEAMAAGLPIVAARAAAVPEVVPDGEVGLLVPPDDVAALADALGALLADPAARAALGAAGRRRVTAYDLPRVAAAALDAALAFPRTAARR